MHLNTFSLTLFVVFAIVYGNARNPHGNKPHGHEPKKQGHKSKPNLVFILLDDVGYNDVGWHNTKMSTPNMNKLANEGVILEHYYSLPLCTPSRSTLITGLYAQQLGLQRAVIGMQEPYGVPLKHKFLPQTLKERAGYSTHAIGKWHLGFCDWRYTPLRRGFDSFFGFYNGAEENYNHCMSKFNAYKPISNCSEYDFRANEEEAHEEYMGQYSGILYAKKAQEIIEKHNAAKPLFMYIALTDAHFPVQPPEQYIAKCKDQVSEARKTFCGAMAASDEAVHNITKALKEKGIYENSVIVVSSDNGGITPFGGNNYPLRGEKGSLWEGGNRVPAFVHSPLIEKKGRVYDGIVHIVDWYATFLHLAGVKQDKSLELQGVNQWNSISKDAEPARNEFPYLIDTINNVPISAVRKGDYKLIAGPAGTPGTVITEEETTHESFNPEFMLKYVSTAPHYDFSETTTKLFNLKDDPNESHNLATEKPEILKDLQKTLHHYQKIAKNAIKFKSDPAGDPELFGHVYSPGWCNAFYNVPDGKSSYFMNINKGDLKQLD